MTWEFEHWNEGKVYLHNVNWEKFKDEIEKNGYKGQKHDWRHNRISLRLHSPRDIITDIPCRGDEKLKHKIELTTHWTMIYESFPAFERTAQDPEGWLPSWNLYAEDNHNEGEEITLLTTGEIFAPSSTFSLYTINFRSTSRNTFAYFRGKYWLVSEYKEYGTGTAPPPKKTKKKSQTGRSIFDPFEESW